VYFKNENGIFEPVGIIHQQCRDHTNGRFQPKEPKRIQSLKITGTMKLFLSVCVVALVAGIVVADDSKGPKVTEKVGASLFIVLPLSQNSYSYPSHLCIYTSAAT